MHKTLTYSSTYIAYIYLKAPEKNLKGPENARIRGNPYKIVLNQCRLNVHKNFLVSVLLLLGIVCLTSL